MLIRQNYLRLRIFVRNAFCAAIAIGSFLSIVSSAFADESYGTPATNIAAYLNKLVSAYPDWIVSRTDELLSMKDGMKFAISDHRNDKSFNELLEHPDIDDIFYVPYPAGSDPKQPPKDFDPG